jgi:glucose/arabinose dehydrogenase
MIWFTALFLAVLGMVFRVEAISLPAGFSDEPVADVLLPTALAFVPDGRLLIATQPGQLRVYQNGALLPAPALDLAISGQICTDRERGLLGVAVDPGPRVPPQVYLFYTADNAGTCVNRVSRFSLSEANVLTGEVVLLDNMPSPQGNHNGGDLHVGHDGHLYVSVGDGFCDYATPDQCGTFNDSARDPSALVGKVLRITTAGGIPPDNPFLGADSARCNLTGRTDPGKRCQEIFASGLRNPFRMAFDPNVAGTRFYINDVGQDTWEEIDEGQKGADYGWNLREAHCRVDSATDCGPPPAGLTNPIFSYSHAAGCGAITGGAFVPAGIWPPELEGAYLFGDYVCGRIFALKRSDTGALTANPFVSDLGVDSAVTLVFGPHQDGQALYYTTFANGGQVRRLAFVGSANRAPTAIGNASPATGAVPLEVRFSAGQSTDPDGDPLAVEWDFGDGAAPVAAVETAHVYGTGGTFFATLRVDDGRGGSDSDSFRIDPGHTPPVITITSPSPSARFRVGQAFTLSARAIDEAGQRLPDAALSWTVRLHHDTHTHPFLAPMPGNDIAIVAPAPEGLPAVRTSFLEIWLTATDTRGLSQTVIQELRPRLVRLRFATDPKRLKLRVHGTTIRAPKTIASWPGFQIQIAAPRQAASGKTRSFRKWSDGRGRRHRITTPAKGRAYKAFFD